MTSDEEQLPRWHQILRNAADRHPLSQKELAARAGIGLGKLKKILNNHEVPSADQTLRLCEVLDLPKPQVNDRRL